MPQERPNHYGHLLEPGYKPGESIGSGYDYRGAATGRIHGDSQRRTSPHFPTVEEAARRRTERRQTTSARAMLVCLTASPLVGYYIGWPYAAGLAVSSLSCFVYACFQKDGFDA